MLTEIKIGNDKRTELHDDQKNTHDNQNKNHQRQWRWILILIKLRNAESVQNTIACQ